MEVSVAFWAGCTSDSTVPAGSLAKAALVGAKTVKGPLPLSVSARPAAWTAATRVEKSGLPTATSTTVRPGWFCAEAEAGVTLAACLWQLVAGGRGGAGGGR